MSVFARVDTCETCRQPVYELKTCGCGHPITAHQFGTGGKAGIRTKCTTYLCECKTFEEVTGGC